MLACMPLLILVMLVRMVYFLKLIRVLPLLRLQSDQAAAKYKADMDAQTRLIIAQMNKAAPPPLNQ